MTVTFPLTLFIWLLVLPFDKERKIIHWLLMHESLILSFMIPIWKINIEGRGKAVKGSTYVIISNHQSILDILIINCLRYKFKWISKIENFNVPIIGWYLRMADYILVDRGNEDSKIEMLDRSYKCLMKGISVMIFPEGTRSPDNEIGFFKRGAFQLALQANVSILPILIHGTGGVLPKHGLIFGTGQKIRIRVLDPILPESFNSETPEALALKISSYMRTCYDVLKAEKQHHDA
jgi:1-acyl-sn-glycerol-3-phosphate acyltransferase